MKYIDLSQVGNFQIVHKCGNAAYNIVVVQGTKTTEHELLRIIKEAITKMKDCPTCKEEIKVKSQEKTDALLKNLKVSGKNKKGVDN